MTHKFVLKIFLATLALGSIYALPVKAQWPTLDISNVANTIMSVVSQTNSTLSTVQSTVSMANMQQAIGDNLGALTKIQDAKKKVEAEKEKLEKIKKRAQKVIELKKQYEEKIKTAADEAKEKYEQAQNAAKMVQNADSILKDAALSAVGDAKSAINGTINNARGSVQGAFDEVKGTVSGAVGEIKETVGSTVNTLQNVSGQTQNAPSKNKGNTTAPSNTLQSANSPSGFSATSSGYQGQIGDSLFDESPEFDYTAPSDNFVDPFVNENKALPSNSAGTLSSSVPVKKQVVPVDDLSLTQRGLTLEEQNLVDSLWEDVSGGESADVPVDVLPSQTPSVEKEIVGTPSQMTPKAFEKTTPVLEEQPALEEKPAPSPLKHPALEEKRDENPILDEAPQAFGKISNSRYVSMGFADAFKTGINKEGRRVLPDDLAQWCNIGYDGMSDEDFVVTEEDMISCIETICKDFHVSNASEATKNIQRFRNIKKQAIASNFALPIEMKQKYNSSKVEEEMEEVTEKSQDATRDQLAGAGEIDKVNVQATQDLLLVQAGMLEIELLSTIENICATYEAEQ